MDTERANRARGHRLAGAVWHEHSECSIRGRCILDPAVQKPRMARMTRLGAGFVMAENFFRGHPPDEHPWHRNPVFIRVIREIRGSNPFTAASEKGVPGPHSPAEMSGLFSKAGLSKKRASVRKRRISALSEARRFVRRACRNTPRTPVWPGRPPPCHLSLLTLIHHRPSKRAANHLNADWSRNSPPPERGRRDKFPGCFPPDHHAGSTVPLAGRRLFESAVRCS